MISVSIAVQTARSHSPQERLSGPAPRPCESVDDLLGNARHQLALLDAREGRPEVVEAVKCSPALDGYTACVPFEFDEGRARALTGGCEGSHDAGGASTCDDDVIGVAGKRSCGFGVSVQGCLLIGAYREPAGALRLDPRSVCSLRPRCLNIQYRRLADDGKVSWIRSRRSLRHAEGQAAAEGAFHLGGKMKTAVLPILCRTPIQVPWTPSVPGTFCSPRHFPDGDARKADRAPGLREQRVCPNLKCTRSRGLLLPGHTIAARARD